MKSCKPSAANSIAAFLLSACGNSTPVVGGSDSLLPPSGAGITSGCGFYPFPSEQWTQCETANVARASEEPLLQSVDAAFLERLEAQSTANIAAYFARQSQDPLWTSETNLCATWGENCVGDPWRYPGVDSFYDQAIVTPVAFYDEKGFRLSGHVWQPNGVVPGHRLPIVVIVGGGAQPPETLYWWAAEALVRASYIVLTFDVRSEGRSDGINLVGPPFASLNRDEVAYSSTLFVQDGVDAADFMLSSPSAPYRPDQTYTLASTDAFNPAWEITDATRLGMAGHSAGAIALSVVQGFDPWPGTSGRHNPVKTVVGWDGIVTDVSGEGISYINSGYTVTPRVPEMTQNADYTFPAPQPYISPPDPGGKSEAFRFWQKAGIPAYSLTIQGACHYEWSLVPGFPASAWPKPDGRGGWTGGWGNPLAEFYTVAWFDRWLKAPGEIGYDTADARLVSDAGWRERMSFYFASTRDFPSRGDRRLRCDNIRRGCN